MQEKQDTILATFRKNGKEITGTGWVYTEGDLLDKSVAVTYPAKLKLTHWHISICLNRYTTEIYLLISTKLNGAAKPATEKFAISTTFEQNGSGTINLKAGEKAKMIVKVWVKADAEYVMLHIPIPAGCNYTSRSAATKDMHREYLKN